MKISLNEIRSINQRYEMTGDIAPGGIDDLVKKIGTQLGGVDEVIDFGEAYQGIVVVKVVSCSKHPDADKLKLCKIDDNGITKDVVRGENGLVQIVCGAPNVREGLLAAWLSPGTVVPESMKKDPLVLEARDIRGQTSYGMLASLKELAIGDDHSGIFEIDEGKAKPGDSFAQTFGLDDYIIDIENKMFTHRPDLFGMLGVARELAGIQHMPFKSPDWYEQIPQFPSVETAELALDVRNEIPDLVPRFSVVAMSGVKVGPSPLWLQLFLAKMGQKSINNIVDYTNFFMMETAQPLHAYDYDKVKALSEDKVTLVVRHPKPEEKLILLNGKEIEPRQESIVIATDQKAIGIGGVMGGNETEVDAKTTNIILESANFDMYSIRRTAMAHGLFTDAVTRFTKGQSPLQTLTVLAAIVSEIQQHANGKVAGGVVDNESHEVREVKGAVKTSVSFINSRLGLALSGEEISQLLQNVEFKVSYNADDSVLSVHAPFWRTDIEIPEDIVEEVGRLYGYDHLALSLPQRAIVPVGPDELLAFKQKIRLKLSSLGANEVLTYSFVHGNLLFKVGQNKNSAFKIANALSPDLQYYRLSITPSILDKVHTNIKAGHDKFAMFEIGKTHMKDFKNDELPQELESLALVYAAQQADDEQPAYYRAKNYLDSFLASIGVSKETAVYEPLVLEGDSSMAYYQLGRSATVKIGHTIIGRIGEYQPSVVKSLKLPEQCAGFELSLLPLIDQTGINQVYQQLSKFPSVTQDICLQVSNTVAYGELSHALGRTLKDNTRQYETIRWWPIDIYSAQNLKGSKRITYRVRLTSFEHTLKEENASALLEKTAAHLAQTLGAIRI